MYQAKIKSLCHKSNLVLLKYAPLAKVETPVDESKVFFVKGKLHNMLFKFKASYCDEDRKLILLNTPREIKVKELRKEERISLKHKHDEQIEFFNTKLDGRAQYFNKANLLDISMGGLAFTMPAPQLYGWEVDDTLYVSHLSGQDLDNPLTARVRYIEETHGRNFRVGLSFNDNILLTHLVDFGTHTVA